MNDQTPTESPAPVALIRPTAAPAALLPFSDESSFISAQRIALALCTSDLVPDTYKGRDKIGNVMIALEIAQRMGASVLAVMQNLYIVHGRPSWSSTFLIATVNTTGKFSPLRFQLSGEGDARTCIAYSFDKVNGERLESPPVSIAMAKAEGWYARNGSKWKTMPENMLRYRAATFFSRLYAPEVGMGMKTVDEVEDFNETTVLPRRTGGVDLSKPLPPAITESVPGDPVPEVLSAEEQMRREGFTK